MSDSLLSYKLQLLHDDNRFNNINLYIQSPGGALLPTLAVVDEIRTLEIPVHTYIRGYEASAATLLSVKGSKRYMYNHSVLMIHSVKLQNQDPTSLLEVKDLNTNSKYGLKKEEKTIANVLSNNGYETAAFGQWRLDGGRSQRQRS